MDMEDALEHPPLDAAAPVLSDQPSDEDRAAVDDAIARAQLLGPDRTPTLDGLFIVRKFMCRTRATISPLILHSPVRRTAFSPSDAAWRPCSR